MTEEKKIKIGKICNHINTVLFILFFINVCVIPIMNKMFFMISTPIIVILFSNLDELVIGDIFTLYTLEEMLTYEIDKIQVVLPEEIDGLAVKKGKDYCTLVTCTPYGINTHRLLVRGHRIEKIRETVVADAVKVDKIIISLVVGILPALVIIIVILRGKTNYQKSIGKRK